LRIRASAFSSLKRWVCLSARTRRFYRARGYGEEARIPDFYTSGEDKVTFRKALGAG
jgi:hypothetical protein